MQFSQNDLDRLLAYGVALTHDRDTAFELLQSSLERFLGKAPADVQHPLAYLRRMMRNRFIDETRWHHRRDPVRFEEDLHSPTTEKELDELLVDEMSVAAVWQELSSSEREIVYFWALEDMTASEIALHLGIPRGTVLSRLHRLRHRLADKYSKSGNQHGS